MSKKVIALIVGLLVLCCCCVIGGALAVTFIISRAPFDVPADKMTVSYLRDVNEVGDYQAVSSLAGDSIESNGTSVPVAGLYNQYFTEDGTYDITDANVNETFIFVQVGDDDLGYDAVVERYDSENCDEVSSNRNGTSGSINFYKGSCGESAYYIYVNGDEERVIIFETIGQGEANLDKFILEYIR